MIWALTYTNLLERYGYLDLCLYRTDKIEKYIIRHKFDLAPGLDT